LTIGCIEESDGCFTANLFPGGQHVGAFASMKDAADAISAAHGAAHA
jgi:hypothetical protein